MNIISVIDNLKGMVHLTPADESDVIAAEKELGVTFADDYRAYVLTYGQISAKGIELTGVTRFPRISVCNVTKDERECNERIPASMYVVESTGLEGVVILQDNSGKIYSVEPGTDPRHIFDSLSDYLRSLQ